MRLPDDVVRFLDRAVDRGVASSRAALVAQAVERGMRQQAAEDDAEILRTAGAADDLDSLVAWTVAGSRLED